MAWCQLPAEANHDQHQRHDRRDERYVHDDGERGEQPATDAPADASTNESTTNRFTRRAGNQSAERTKQDCGNDDRDPIRIGSLQDSGIGGHQPTGDATDHYRHRYPRDSVGNRLHHERAATKEQRTDQWPLEVSEKAGAHRVVEQQRIGVREDRIDLGQQWPDRSVATKKAEEARSERRPDKARKGTPPTSRLVDEQVETNP